MKIIRNSLETNFMLGKLFLEDDFYLIKLYYCGNYKKEKDTGLDRTYMSALVIPKKKLPTLHISFSDKDIYLSFEDLGYARASELDSVVQKFEIVRQETEELRKYLEEYFFCYY